MMRKVPHVQNKWGIGAYGNPKKRNTNNDDYYYLTDSSPKNENNLMVAIDLMTSIVFCFYKSMTVTVNCLVTQNIFSRVQQET